MTRIAVTALAWVAMAAFAAGCGGKAAAPVVSEGVRLFEAQDYDGAKAYFEDATARVPGDVEAAYYLGRIAIAQERHDEALTHMKHAVELAPDSSGYHFWLAVAYANKVQNTKDFMEQGQLAPLMKASIEKAVELDPASIEARQFLAQYLLNAPPIVGGDPARAVDQIDEIKRLDPKRGFLFNAQILSRSKKYDDALAELQQAQAIAPDDVDICFQIGRVYQDKEDYGGAFAAFEKALGMDSEHMPSLYQIGRTGVFSGENLERGVACLQKYLKSEPAPGEPTWSHAQWRLGQLYEKQGKGDLARAAFEKALALDPDNENARKSLEALEQ